MADSESFVIHICRDDIFFLVYSAVVVHLDGDEEPYLKLIPFRSLRQCRAFRDRLQSVVLESELFEVESAMSPERRETAVDEWMLSVDHICREWGEEYVPLDMRVHYHYAQLFIFGHEEDDLKDFGDDFGRVPIA